MPNRAPFTFEITETIFLDKAYGVEEMIRVSLDPVVSFQTDNSYMNIHGVLELNGEFVKADLEEHVEDDFRENHAKQFMKNVQEIDDQRIAFHHPIPVNISIPTYRVKTDTDMMVNVTSFDYELSNAHQLRLIATVNIDGITELEKDTLVESKQETPEEDNFQFTIDTRDEDIEMIEQEDLEPEEVLSADVLRSGEIEEPSDKRLEEISHLIEEFSNAMEEEQESVLEELTKLEIRAAEDYTVEEDEPEPVVEEVTNLEIRAAEDYIVKEDEPEPVVEEVTNLETRAAEDYAVEEDEPEPVVEEKTNLEIRATADYTVDEDEEEEDLDRGSVSYLADIFSNDEQENETAQLRICIVQGEDTLESISERFSVSKAQIQKQNQLEDEILNTGQLLIIPSRK
ncbi:stage VI sporulation protein D [Ornithinibacillus sp. 4-3]|uniref:Stage VI sporulation protein D n=1 Tax=Ornithinibacillus sp. 4-3 TaxID=3231488 RepID=A0AB39HHX5_9BACI